MHYIGIPTECRTLKAKWNVNMYSNESTQKLNTNTLSKQQQQQQQQHWPQQPRHFCCHRHCNGAGSSMAKHKNGNAIVFPFSVIAKCKAFLFLLLANEIFFCNILCFKFSHSKSLKSCEKIE